MRGILETGEIRVGNVGVAKHGRGIYLTSMSPDQGKERILQNNYGSQISNIKRRRADYFFKLEPRSLQYAWKVGGYRRGEDIWVHRQVINLIPNNYSYGIVTVP